MSVRRVDNGAMVVDEIGWWLGERQREDLVGLVVAGLRQQMGGGQGA